MNRSGRPVCPMRGAFVDPTAVTPKAEAVSPSRTPLAVNVRAPDPPWFTGNAAARCVTVT